MSTAHVTCSDHSFPGTGLRRLSFPALMMLLCVSASMTFAADAMSQSADFDIAPQSVESALHEWSRQSNVQVMVASHEVNGQRTDGVKGRLTAASALAQLLQPTNLKYERVGENTITVTRVAAKTGTDAKDSAPEPSSKPTTSTSGTGRNLDENRQRLGLEEVVVTAQRREERLQDVPMSISVLGGSDLDQFTAQGVSEALSQVPGVATTVTNQGGTTLLSVRGVSGGAANFNGSSPIAYYLDSVPFGFVKSAFAPDSNSYDMERIEILRGPQGTLYGASAQNGVVRVLTKDANLSDFELKARASLSATDGSASASSRVDAAINIPLIAEKLAARAVVGYQDLSGWIDKPTKKDANDGEVRNLRLKIKAQPTDQLSIGLSSWISESDFGATPFADENNFSPSQDVEPISTDYSVYGLDIDYQFSEVSLSFATGFLDYHNDSNVDRTRLVPNSFIQTVFDSDVFSQEVNLNSASAGPWRWSIGGIYREAEDRLYAYATVGYRAPTILYDTSKSYAVFGEVTRLLFDGKWEITGGLRYFKDDVTNRETSRSTNVPPEQLITSDAAFDAVSPRVVLTWHPSDEATVYASYSEGFRSGFPQNGPVIAAVPQIPPLEADNLSNYELGAKASLWDGRLIIDSAVFYIDWQDVQQTLGVNVGTGGVPVFITALVNGESASGGGVEFAATWQPAERLTLGLNFGWNDLSLDSAIVNESAAGSIVLFSKGERLNLSPEYIAGASFDYAFSLGGKGYEGRLSASANYTSEQDSRTIFNGVRIGRGDETLIGRSSFSLYSPDGWSATLFVDNINDEQGAVTRNPLVEHWTLRPRPRTVGVQLDYHF